MDLKVFFVDFQKFYENQKFENYPLGSCDRGRTQNLDPISSAVLTFIGYKQNKQTCNVYLQILGFQGASRLSSLTFSSNKCEHFLFVYIVKQKQQQKFADFLNKIRGFSKFNGNQIFLEANF